MFTCEQLERQQLPDAYRREDGVQQIWIFKINIKTQQYIFCLYDSRAKCSLDALCSRRSHRRCVLIAQMGFARHIASNTCCQISRSSSVEMRLCNLTCSAGVQIRFSVWFYQSLPSLCLCVAWRGKDVRQCDIFIIRKVSFIFVYYTDIKMISHLTLQLPLYMQNAC